MRTFPGIDVIIPSDRFQTEAVAEIIVQQTPVPMRIMGMPDEITVEGDSGEIFEHYGITPEGIKQNILSILKD